MVRRIEVDLKFAGPGFDPVSRVGHEIAGKDSELCHDLRAHLQFLHCPAAPEPACTLVEREITFEQMAGHIGKATSVLGPGSELDPGGGV